MIRLPTDLNIPQAVYIVGAWSIMALGGGAYIGVSCSDQDCGTCEAALDAAIDELHKCQRDLLDRSDLKCEDERQAERDRCKQTLSEYKRLRCRICEASHDTYPPEPADDSHASP